MKLLFKGSLHLEDGILACIPLKVLLALLTDKAGLTAEQVEEFLNDVIKLNLHGEDIDADIYQSVSIHKDGSTFRVPVIGIDPDKHVRFLQENEKTLAQFTRSHPAVRFRLKKDSPETDIIRKDYKKYLMPRYNPELDEALGIDVDN